MHYFPEIHHFYRLRILLFLCVAFAFCTEVFAQTAASSEAVPLRLRLETGKTYRMDSESVLTVDQEIGGRKVVIDAKVNGRTSFQVLSADSGGYTMEVRYSKMWLEMKLPQNTLVFSSDSAEARDPFSQILARIADKPFRLKMNRNGTITEVTGMEGLIDSALEVFPGLPEGHRSQIRGQILDAYGKKGLKGSLEMVTAIYPDKPVKEGESWVAQTRLETTLTADVTTTYTFKGRKEGVALIEGNSRIETPDDAPAGGQNALPVRAYKMNGTMQSQIKADLHSGWIGEARITQEIAGTWRQKGAGETDVPIVMKSSARITGN